MHSLPMLHVLDPVLHHPPPRLRHGADTYLRGTRSDISPGVRLSRPMFACLLVTYALRIRCLIMDPTIRVVGATSLWAIEIVMQLRVYALFNCSKKVSISVSSRMPVLLINPTRLRYSTARYSHYPSPLSSFSW